MSTFNNIIARGNGLLASRDINDDGNQGTLIDLMIVFVAIAFFALALVVVLVMLRRVRHRRRMENEALPQYNDIKHSEVCNTNRLTIQTADGRSSILVLNHSQPMLADPKEPPLAPNNIPEIHITFPDEQDEHGRQQGGRVMVVRVGDATVGLEPVHDEQLPAYEKENSHGFYSIDMDNIGGLKEKDRSQFS